MKNSTVNYQRIFSLIEAQIQEIFSATRSVLILSILLVCVGAAQAQRKFPVEVLQPALWEKIDTASPTECAKPVLKCAADFLSATKIMTSGTPKFSVYRLGERDGRNLTIVFVSYKIRDDDSLSGVRYRLAMSLGDVEDNSYKLETLGRQVTCFRGHKNWSKLPCR